MVTLPVKCFFGTNNCLFEELKRGQCWNKASLISRAIRCQLSCSCSYSHLPAAESQPQGAHARQTASIGISKKSSPCNSPSSFLWQLGSCQVIQSDFLHDTRGQLHPGNEHSSCLVVTFTIFHGISLYWSIRGGQVSSEMRTDLQCLGLSMAHTSTFCFPLGQDLSLDVLEVWQGTTVQPCSHLAALSRLLMP